MSGMDGRLWAEMLRTSAVQREKSGYILELLNPTAQAYLTADDFGQNFASEVFDEESDGWWHNHKEARRVALGLRAHV
eukprot:1327370-Pyramimonas_sp.AAC.1